MIPDETPDSTPLIVAVLNEQHDILKMLLESELYDVNQTDEHAWTPLIWAVWRKDIKAVEILIDCPTLKINQVTNLGRTALHFACMSMTDQAFNIVKKLLSVPNIDINIKDVDGSTALSKTFKMNVRMILVQHGAKE